MVDDQIFKMISLQPVSFVFRIPAAYHFVTEAGLGMNLDQNFFIVLGMLQERIKGIPLK
jgi:hypothetical protein